jgi:hypothetical protein
MVCVHFGLYAAGNTNAMGGGGELADLGCQDIPTFCCWKSWYYFALVNFMQNIT